MKTDYVGQYAKKNSRLRGSRPIILFVYIKLVSQIFRRILEVSGFGLVFFGLDSFGFFRIWFWFSSVWILLVFSGSGFGLWALGFGLQQYKDAPLSTLLITYSVKHQKPSIFGRFEGLD